MTSAVSSTSSPARGGDGARLAAVGALCRLLVMMRLAALVLSILSEVQQPEPRSEVLFAQAGVGVATSLLLMRWQDATSLLCRPGYMALDVAATVGMLGVTGPEGPFLSYTLGTAGLAGVMFGRRGAALASAALMLGYWAVLLADPATTHSFQGLVGRPALYPGFAAAGAALRQLMDREAETIAALHTTQAEVAAQQERARLARELHDFLGKSLVGLSLGATGLVALIRRDPKLAQERAVEFATAARDAVHDARELVGDLRERDSGQTLAEAVRRITGEWARRAGQLARVTADDSVRAPESTRRELLAVLDEALRNVARHARARHVEVALRAVNSTVELTVRDDGRGMDPSVDLGDLTSRRRYGVLGMRERADRLGGVLTVGSLPGAGTTVAARFPV